MIKYCILIDWRVKVVLSSAWSCFQSPPLGGTELERKTKWARKLNNEPFSLFFVNIEFASWSLKPCE